MTVRETRAVLRATNQFATRMETQLKNLKRDLAEVDGLINEYGIDTVGTGSAPPKAEQDRVDAIIEKARKRLAQKE